MQRSTIDLDGPWEFAVDPEAVFTSAAFATIATRTVAVPAPWQSQADDLRQYAGVAWYRRRFAAPDTEHGYGNWLRFGAVDYHATIWLNGELLGEHEGGYLPFELRADSALRPGDNELVVRVLDPGPGSRSAIPFDEIPHGKQSWYGPLGGIWQSVSLETRPLTHISRIHVTPQPAEECATVALMLNQAYDHNVTLHLHLHDPHGAVVEHTYTIEAGQRSFMLTLPVPAPLLWDIDQPHLYLLKASLQAGAAPVDISQITFGMRSIATRNGQLLLNGRPIYLRGALDQDYYPDLIATPFSDEELDRQFYLAKQMGLNCLRTHIKITDPRYYAAADRAGLLIWTELPNWELLTDETKRRAEDTLRGMVERDWNHPSIVIWTIINEGWGVDLLHNAEHRAWLAATYDWLKQHDPYRLVVGNSPCHGNAHVVTDLEDFHYYAHIPDHYHVWHDWVASFAGRATWSYAHDLSDYWQLRRYNRQFIGDWQRTLSAEVRRTEDEPLVVSEFGNWGLPDVALLYRHYGGEPWWFETGFEWGDGVVYPHGIEQRFATYHLDKVFGDVSELAAASQRMQFLALKYQIEEMRRQPAIQGYVITEFTDVHWECNGLLDMCRNPKQHFAQLAHINADDVLIPCGEFRSFGPALPESGLPETEVRSSDTALPDVAHIRETIEDDDADRRSAIASTISKGRSTTGLRTVYRLGEHCTIGVSLSHFSQHDLAGAQVAWSCRERPELHGVVTGFTPHKASVVDCGTISFVLPEVEAPARLTLELHLVDGRGERRAFTTQDVYVFPPPKLPQVIIAAPDPDLAAELRELGYRVSDDWDAADVVVTTELDMALRRYAQNGGRVVLLAETRRALRSALPHTRIEARRGRSWQGDWASSFSWIRGDTIFGNIPTDRLVDFAFADLTPDYVISGVSPRDFADRVHAGLFVGWLHNVVALVAERPIGRGHVLVSTFRLRRHLANNPLAQELLASMVRSLL
jgi:hypothetical protein